jgi:hypothetical protein
MQHWSIIDEEEGSATYRAIKLVNEAEKSPLCNKLQVEF